MDGDRMGEYRCEHDDAVGSFQTRACRTFFSLYSEVTDKHVVRLLDGRMQILCPFHVEMERLELEAYKALVKPFMRSDG